MQVRCPSCHTPFDSVAEASWAEILCPSCGSSFSLIGSETTAAYRPGTRVLGHFELLEELGIGRFGSVWKARDTKLQRQVAIKIPRAGQLDSHESELFLRDARAAAQLNHPHIVGVHEVGREGETLYIVSDYIEGANLREWLSGQRLTVREAAGMVVKICEALDHAHEAGVVHRDLKPSNIMIDLDGEPHVIDFGLARRAADDVTLTVEGQVLGTPAYMSPEQARGEGHQADRRADIYSLGVILFELLTGELPFRGEARMLVVQILREEPPGPRKLNARIPRDLETITLKCLEKEPARRYQTSRELADDLRCWLDGKPVLARPVSRLERSWRWCKRNPVVAGLVAAVVLALVTGTGLSSYFAIRSRAFAADADARAQEAIAERERADIKAAEAQASARAALQEKQRADAKADEAKASATRAAEETQRAIVEARKAQQVARFLGGMFEESAPFQELGLRFGVTEKSLAAANLTARQILDRGTQRVSAELQDQPEVQAALKDTLSNVYLGLGDLDQAESLLLEALELRRKHLPAVHLDTATSLHSLGILRLAQYRGAQSASALREALAIRRKLLGENHELVDNSRAALGTVLGLLRPERASADEAIELYRETLEWRRNHFGKEHRQTALAMIGLAGSLLNKGKNDDAARLVVEATPIFLKDPATKSLGLAVSHFQQAVIMARLGQRDAAIASIRKSLAAAHDFADDGHPFVMYANDFAIGLLVQLSQFDEAEPLLLARYSNFNAARGPKDESTIGALNRLVRLYEVWQKPEKAEQYRKLLQSDGTAQDPNHDK